ncbi:contractile injection system protein, VgrG/Pvc8 family [Burkholderia sp. 3C]
MNEILGVDATRAFSVQRLGAPEPRVFLHCAVFVNRNTVLGAETFRLESFQGQEQVSEPFEFQLELSGNSSGAASGRLRFDELVGRAITVGIAKPVGDAASSEGAFQAALDGDSVAAEQFSLFNGIVTSFAAGHRGNYSIGMKPALHRLGLTNHYRVFNRRTVREMIELLLDAHHIAYAPIAVTLDNLATIRRQDWMQAGETDLEFLKRLMGKALMHYYFVHGATGHRVVFSNLPQYPEVAPGQPPLRYTYTETSALGMEQDDLVTEFSMKQTLASTGVHGVLTQQDGAWLTNRVVQFNSFSADEHHDADPLPFNLYKSYQYGGGKEEARILSRSTQSSLESSRRELSGASRCSAFRVGHRFRLRAAGDGETPEATFLDGAFVLTSVSHQASMDGGYQNHFQAGDAAFLITPYSIQSTQQGAVLAEVVSGTSAPAQPPIDFGAASSFATAQASFVDTLNPGSFPQIGVHVRFSTAAKDDPPVWIKLSASMQTAPTIGAIVVVSRAQDESELPEIQNVIQSNGSTLVVPSGWLSNTHVGSQYSTNYGDNQTINYGRLSAPDLGQATRIVSSAYASGHFGNASFSQGAGYSFSCADPSAPGARSNPAELYGGGQPEGDILSATEAIGSTYSRTSGTRSYSHSVFGTSISDSTVGDEQSTRAVGDSSAVSIVGSSVSLSTTGISMNTNITGSVIDSTMVGSTVRTTISGDTLETSLSGDTVRNTVSGDLIEDSVSGNVMRNTTSGNVMEVSLTGNVTRNTTTGNVFETSLTGNTTRTETTGLTVVDHVNCGETVTKINGVVQQSETSGASTTTATHGDTTRIETSGATSNIVTMAAITVVETAGPGARVSNNDETPHVDNIVTRIHMIEATLIFM